jgi:hydroxylysine kinase
VCPGSQCACVTFVNAPHRRGGARAPGAYDGRVPDVPRVSPEQAEGIARRQYGVDGRAQRLAAEHDDTFRLTAGDGSARLLKIGLADEGNPVSRPVPSLQTAALLHLASAAPALPVQRVVALRDGRPEAYVAVGGRLRLVRLTSWLDGELLGRAAVSAALRRETGTTLARLNLALREFRHPGARRTHRWDLQEFWRLRALLDELPGSGLLPEVAAALPAGGPAAGGLPAGGPPAADGLRGALEECLNRFDAVVRPALPAARTQLVHADFHGENLLTDGQRITGILDFGDALTGPVAMDVGIAACYQLGQEPDVLAPALDLVAGYHAVDPLADGDLDLVAEFTVARVAARIIVSQWNAAREPANHGYLLRRTPQAVRHLTALRRLAPGEIAGRLRVACR